MYRRSRFFLSFFLVFTLAASARAEFVPTGWDTAKDFPLIGDPAAKKGGTVKSHWTDFPPTLRTEGPNSNLSTTRSMHGMIFESLVSLHPETLEYIPVLADHWKISKDKRTFWFHIDPRARWADGSPVTSEDVVETWKWLNRKDLKDPYTNMFAGENFELPVAESSSIIRVHTKKLHWRLFYYFGGQSIYPAKVMKDLTGDEYLDSYNWKLQMGSGPYELKPEGIEKEHSITITRREDYWAKDDRRNIGLNNFDKISWVIVRDDELAFEKFKKGELDFYVVQKAQRWAEETEFDKVKKGWIQKRKIYTQAPEGFSGFVFNMHKPPFNDRNVRKAFALLFNRKRLIDKLFFNQYSMIDSYYPGNMWGNPKNPKIRYNPRLAARLLARAGYKERNKDGWLVGKDGKPFEITLEYAGGPSWTRIHKVIQEDIQKAGIKMNLKEIDQRTLMKKVDERNFTLHLQSWGALLFPNPRSSWSSELADKQHNNNLPGFKDPKVDELCDEYDKTFDRKKQVEIIRQIDRRIFSQYPYALGWYANFNRVLYWNKFAHPKTYFSKIGDYGDIKAYWWEDAKKEAALETAEESGKSLPRGETIQKPWAGK